MESATISFATFASSFSTTFLTMIRPKPTVPQTIPDLGPGISVCIETRRQVLIVLADLNQLVLKVFDQLCLIITLLGHQNDRLFPSIISFSIA